MSGFTLCLSRLGVLVTTCLQVRMRTDVRGGEPRLEHVQSCSHPGSHTTYFFPLLQHACTCTRACGIPDVPLFGLRKRVPVELRLSPGFLKDTDQWCVPHWSPLLTRLSWSTQNWRPNRDSGKVTYVTTYFYPMFWFYSNCLSEHVLKVLECAHHFVTFYVMDWQRSTHDIHFVFG